MNRKFNLSQIPFVLCLALALLGGAGCGGNHLETEYAKPRGKSINGISTFLQLLRNEGHRVETVPYLSPRIGLRSHFLVIFHDSTGPLDADSQKAIDEFCDSPLIHTILVVLKNGDMTEEYFLALEKSGRLEPGQLTQVREALDTITESKKRNQTMGKQDFSLGDTGGLYGLKKVDRTRTEKPLLVDVFPFPDVDEENRYVPPGTSPEIRPPTENRANGDPNKHSLDPDIRALPVRWHLERRLIPGKDAYVKWSSGQDPLLTQQIRFGTRFFVLASAVPLLNAGLADPGNRTLCEEITRLFPPNSQVTVSTSSDWRPSREDDEPDGSVLRFLKVQPYPWIFGQALLAIVFFCWWKYPIFGRPRAQTGEVVNRFGRHIDALGDLLRRTRNRSFILKRIQEWQRVRNNLK